MSGYTLIEIIVAITIMGVCALVAVPSWREPAAAGARREAAVQQLMRDARELALVRASAVGLVIDPGSCRYELTIANQDSVASGRIPDCEKSENEQMPMIVVRALPTGASHADRIDLDAQQ